MNVGAQQGIRFLLVGAVNTLLDLGIYSTLRFLGFPLYPANFVSTLAGLTFSYFGNSRYTFKNQVEEQDRPRTIVLFFLVTGFGIWVLHPLVILLLEPLVEPLAANIWEPIAVFLPKLGAIFVGLLWNFFCYRNLVFKHRITSNE